ncbi:hypothetical protein QQG74_21860 [Micromonospora sp. FIMYZ51]
MRARVREAAFGIQLDAAFRNADLHSPVRARGGNGWAYPRCLIY